MTLNKQLLCVSLLLFSLPWVGCQYLREMDTALKRGQQQTLAATATVIAKALSQNPDLLFPHDININGQETEINGGETEATPVYCHPLPAPIRADGYFDEWSDEYQEVPWTEFYTQDRSHHLRYRCGMIDSHLALSFAIDDSELIYNNPTQSLIDNGDRLVLKTANRDYILTAVAPGEITARYAINPHTIYPESTINAAWIDNEQGYQIELTLPFQLAATQLSFSVIDETTSHTVRYGPHEHHQPPQFVYQPAAATAVLSTFQQPGMRLRLTTPQGLLTASVGSPAPNGAAPAHWLLKKLYRAILLAPANKRADYADGIDFSSHQELRNALEGSISSHWYQDPEHSNHQLLTTAAPIIVEDATVAVLLAEQSSEQTAALTDQAFSRLFALSMAVLALTTLALLSYASWLSWRVRQLSRAAQHALDERGKINLNFPTSNARDEIGLLTRNYAELMKRIAEYTDYLQTLSRKLSHELRTPLAIIHSSLDNLASQPLDATSQTYQQRAKDGALRLGKILTAMSEARRVEESIEQAESETIDICQLLQELTLAYRDIYPQQRIETEGLGAGSDPEWIDAVPELIVQMLDKLIENAASFCPASGRIIIALQPQTTTIEISISNDGPPLPDNMRSQLFDNMVSLRDRDEQSMHLGLGLYIVNLIANYHGGEVSANNRADQSGVIFSIRLPRSQA